MDNEKNTTTSTTTNSINKNIVSNNSNKDDNKDDSNSNNNNNGFIENHRLEKIFKDISKKYEHKIQFKQESVLTLEKIIELFLKTLIENTEKIPSTSSSFNNTDNKEIFNSLNVNEIYKAINNLDLDFLLPDGSITKCNNYNGDKLNENFYNDNEEDSDE